MLVVLGVGSAPLCAFVAYTLTCMRFTRFVRRSVVQCATRVAAVVVSARLFSLQLRLQNKGA